MLLSSNRTFLRMKRKSHPQTGTCISTSSPNDTGTALAQPAPYSRAPKSTQFKEIWSSVARSCSTGFSLRVVELWPLLPFGSRALAPPTP
eukprot:3890804-Amphidinium_carterae.1